MKARHHSAGLLVTVLLAIPCVSQTSPSLEETGVPFSAGSAGFAETGQRLVPPDLEAGDIYGAAVALDGAIAVVASEWDDDNGRDAGAAYVYRRTANSWVQEAKLKPHGGRPGDNFGRSVALQGEVAVVGCHWDDDLGSQSGSVFIFRYVEGAWKQVSKLTAKDGQAGDRFGISVSIDGDLVGVAAWMDDSGGKDAGSAYLFRREGDGWRQQAKLLASDASAGDCFGRSISVSGDVAVVGAFLEDEGGEDAGAAYVFRWDGSRWLEEQKLVPADAAAGDFYGWTVAVAGDVVVVGAYRDDDAATDSGSVYVYRFDGDHWCVEQKLGPADGAEGEWFGYSVAADDQQLLVGAPVRLQTVAGPGSAYLFHHKGDEWIEERRIIPSDGSPQDAFGFQVSLSGQAAACGAWRADPAGKSSGAAYLYDLSKP